MATMEFQSTPPCGGDVITILQVCFPGISIHAPLRGRLVGVLAKLSCILFQSTPPCGGDVSTSSMSDWVTDFNPRPLAGATARLEFSS